VIGWGPTDRSPLTPLDGGVTAVAGFTAGGVAAGLKPSGASDLALVAAPEPVAAAVVATTNQVRAAPCQVTERHARDGRARAVVINAGNANACTGERGVRDAEATAAEVARLLGCDATDVLVLSTGIIGVPMPIERLLAGLPAAVDDLSADGSARAAAAITTTDSASKQVAVEVGDDHGTCRIGGIAKGAGMIEPAMATMLTVLTTDAPLSGAVLRTMLARAVQRTFNRITIDACGSTNDTVVLLANGTAARPCGVESFQTGLDAVCADLAHRIVSDGEGTSRIAAVTVRGAVDEPAAEGLARAICSSVLVRAALHGADPNWGRILAAMGATDIPFEPARVSVACGGITVCRFGTATAFDRGQAAAAMDRAEVDVTVDLGLGPAAVTMLTADLTPDYVAENAYYTT
jgi:glutamate N-acetyltransferase / amino-acid N-acetyltransferase